MSKQQEFVEDVRAVLEKLESTNAYNTQQIEACLDALASAVWAWKGKKNHEPKSVLDSIEVLPFDKKTRQLLAEIYSEIQSSIEGADYDDDDDDQAAERLSDLIADFYFTFDKALKKHEP